ncbi:TULIP family P47-like protein [Brevibacterium sp. JNUCC-42]|nr:TULIP family P47-like protein [Brevibacterium sp. JNUCC-42]
MIILNTYGWDVVHVGTIDFMNKQLKKYMNDNKITFTYVDENTSVTLTFDNWEIVPGGASKLLRVKTLVKEGELIFMGNSTKIDDICPVLELQLGFFQQSNTQKLAFNFLVKGEREGDQREGAVTVIDPDINKVFSPGNMVYTFLKLTLADMFINNKGRVSHIFAELNGSTSISWMKPEKYKYSYYSPTNNPEKGFLVIFSVVTNRDISTLPESIDGAILDNNHDSFLVLSEKLFLEHIVMPELPNSFGHGATINHFRFESTSPTTGVIKNTRDLGAAPVRSGLIDYYPVFTNLNIKVEGNKLHMKASGKCDVTGLPGGYISFDVEAKYSFSYDRNNKRIQFNLDSTPKVHTEQHIPAWVWVTGLVWIGIIYGMVSALESSLATALRINLNTNIGKLKADVVRWSGMDQEEITDCVLDVAFCIKGTSEELQKAHVFEKWTEGNGWVRGATFSRFPGTKVRYQWKINDYFQEIIQSPPTGSDGKRTVPCLETPGNNLELYAVDEKNDNLKVKVAEYKSLLTGHEFGSWNIVNFNHTQYVNGLYFNKVPSRKVRYQLSIDRVETAIKDAYPLDSQGRRYVNFLDFNAGRGIPIGSRVQVLAVDDQYDNLRFQVALRN